MSMDAEDVHCGNISNVAPLESINVAEISVPTGADSYKSNSIIVEVIDMPLANTIPQTTWLLYSVIYETVDVKRVVVSSSFHFG